MLFYKHHIRLDPYDRSGIPWMKARLLKMLNNNRLVFNVLSDFDNDRTAVTLSGNSIINSKNYNNRKFEIKFLYARFKYKKITKITDTTIIIYHETHIRGNRAHNGLVYLSNRKKLDPIPLGKVKVRGFKGSWLS